MFYLQSISIYFGITVFKYFTEEKRKEKRREVLSTLFEPRSYQSIIRTPRKTKIRATKIYDRVFSDVREGLQP